ncbi:MAG: two-component regulator propeller domain-containing protein [Vicingaceae bacterium]
MLSKITLLFFTLTLLLLFPAKAQHQISQDQISFFEVQTSHISQKEGLAQGMINAMVEDSLGYLWIGTKDGLHRYDGKQFKIYRPSFNEEKSISDGYITSLFVDSKGRLWVGTVSGGLNLYDEKKEKFIALKQDSTKTNSISSNHIVRISELGTNQLMIETKNGSFFEILSISENKGKKFFSFIPLSEKIPALKSVLDSIQNVQTHFTTPDGSLWIYTFERVIRIKFDQALNTARVEQHRIRPKGYLSYSESSQVSTFIENLFEADSSIYALKNKNTLLKYNWNKQAFENFLSVPNKIHFKGRLVLDGNNNLWTFQSNGRIIKTNLSDFSVQLDTNTTTKLRKIMAGQLYFNAEQDQNGSLWLGTPGLGIIKLKDHSKRFSVLPISPYYAKKNFRYYAPKKPTLFSKAYQKYLYRLQIDSLLKSNSLAKTSKTFQHLTIDQDSTVWLPAESINSEQGFLIGLKKEGELIKVPLRIANSGFGLLPWVMQVDEEGTIWFYSQADNEVGHFNSYDPSAEKLNEFPIPTDMRQNEYPFVSDFIQDEKGVFYFATMDGLYSFNPQDEEWEQLRISSNSNNSKTDPRIFSLLQAPTNDSLIWLGTDGSGLYKFNKYKLEAKRFTEQEGLPNSVVYGILADHRNNLWLSTNQGLCLFNTSTYQTRNFSIEDGLAFMEFNRYAYCKDGNGKLYFEGQGKIIKVNPSEFYRDRKASKVLINRFKILNQEVSHNQEASLGPKLNFSLESPISQSKKITLPHQAIMFSIGFSMLDLSSPNENKYQYRLRGFNDEWLDAGIEQEATFTNISSGDYVFEVRGLNSHDVWSEPTSLQIEMLAPWYETVWFILAVLTGLISLLYVLYKYRVNELLRVERMRNEIAQDLHDEIGSTLSSISLYSAVMQKRIKNLSPKANQMLGKIIENTGSVMSSMNDMVWSIKADNDNFESVTNRLRAFAVSIAESQNMQLSFEVDADAEKLELGMQERKNTYLIFKEAINNAAKYSKATKLQVAIQLKDKTLTIAAQDNGVGFEATETNQDQLSLSGNGIAGMQDRAKQIKADFFIQSAEGKGCTVQLKLKV